MQIIYRDKIKVYYSSQAAAHADEYFENGEISNSGGKKQTGLVYPFTGLRGDAKELWRKARKGHEPKL